MEQNNLEQLIKYVSEHNNVYFSLARTARRFNVPKKTLRKFMHNNSDMFRFTKDGLLVGYGGQNKTFFRYINQNVNLEIN